MTNSFPPEEILQAHEGYQNMISKICKSFAVGAVEKNHG